VKWRNP